MNEDIFMTSLHVKFYTKCKYYEDPFGRNVYPLKFLVYFIRKFLN